MDVRLPGIDGISAVKRISEAAPSVKTVVFSAYGDKRLLSDAHRRRSAGLRAEGLAAGGPAARGPHRLRAASRSWTRRSRRRC